MQARIGLSFWRNLAMIACAFVGIETHQCQFHGCQSDFGSPDTVESLTAPELQIVRTNRQFIVSCVSSYCEKQNNKPKIS